MVKPMPVLPAVPSTMHDAKWRKDVFKLAVANIDSGIFGCNGLWVLQSVGVPRRVSLQRPQVGAGGWLKARQFGSQMDALQVAVDDGKQKVALRGDGGQGAQAKAGTA